MTDQSDFAHGQAGALEAMLTASDSDDLGSDYPRIAKTMTREDYKAIIDAAWRYQFSDDRQPFKHDIRELQKDVSRRAQGGAVR